MSDLAKRLLASIRIDAINGNAHERMVCERQMAEAARVLGELERANDELRAENERLLAENLILQRGREEDARDHWGDMHALYAARSLVKRQAEEEGLWFPAVTASEAYLQAALRELHAAIEGGEG